ncbi:MAG TPA: ATP-binding protein [Thermoanaerobaculia bacterium]|nr:ATP-binding protein [Thermoanaerobaculia bacterium]
MTKLSDVGETPGAALDLRALLEAGEGYRLLVDAVEDYAIFSMDPEGKVASWNAGAQRLLGYEAEEILGRDGACFFTPDEAQAGVPEAELRKAAETGRASDDRWHVRKNGSYFFASGITTSLRDAQGALLGYVKIMRDRTDRKRLDEELRNRAEALARADEEKDEFLAVLAHELRNPLAPVFYALRLLDEKPLDDPNRWYIRRIVDRQMRRLARLIDDLLDVSRIRTGKVELRKSRIDLGAVIGHAVEVARPLAEDRGHGLDVSLFPEPVWLEADPVRLEQVFTNLLSNAVKFTEDGGRIWLAAERQGQEVVVRVRDTGVGIPPDLLPRVFDLFTQGDRSIDRARDGLGIGLTLSRRLVEMHGGTIEARSEGVGRGSEFVVRLPAFLHHGPPDEETLPARAAEATSRPLRVLVVDDSEDTTELLGTLLEMAGHSIQVAHTGPSALEAAAAFRPDAIILDIGLPGLDGYQVAQRLRGDPALKSVTLIAATGYGQEEDLRRSREVGFDQHLVKPIDPGELQRLLAELAGRVG